MTQLQLQLQNEAIRGAAGLAWLSVHVVIDTAKIKGYLDGWKCRTIGSSALSPPPGPPVDILLYMDGFPAHREGLLNFEGPGAYTRKALYY